jgi:hypothetical protein
MGCARFYTGQPTGSDIRWVIGEKRAPYALAASVIALQIGMSFIHVRASRSVGKQMNNTLPATTASQHLPLSYTQACKALSECVRVDECKGWADKAAAVAAYAKMVRNVQLEADAKRIRLRATRRIGEIIGADGRASVSVIMCQETKRPQIIPNAAASVLSLSERSTARKIAQRRLG